MRMLQVEEDQVQGVVEGQVQRGEEGQGQVQVVEEEVRAQGVEVVVQGKVDRVQEQVMGLEMKGSNGGREQLFREKS